jgi:integrase
MEKKSSGLATEGDAQMKGHIRERSPGHWAIILDQRDPATGKRKRKWHSFSGTKRDAQVACSRLIAELSGGSYIEPAKTMVAQFLRQWLDSIKPNVTPKTHERYTEIVTKNLIPAIGAIVLTKLQPQHIAEAYAKALASGRRKDAGSLSPSTVHYMHRVLKQALTRAARWQMLTRNPANAVDPPKVERAKMNTYDLNQTAELLDAVRHTTMFFPVLLGVLCGLRRGEIAALRWRNIDLAGGQLSVVESAEQTTAGVRYKEPKSGRARTVALAASVVEELRLHRVRQAEELLKVGVRQTEATFVCCREDGEPLQPRTLTQNWRRLAVKGTLPRIRFHDLRHAHATHLLAAGVHPKVASERLGHSKVGITLDLYSHVLPGMQEDAAARVDEALRVAVKKRAPKEIG